VIEPSAAVQAFSPEKRLDSAWEGFAFTQREVYHGAAFAWELLLFHKSLAPLKLGGQVAITSLCVDLSQQSPPSDPAPS
jgi:hypothetical protein